MRSEAVPHCGQVAVGAVETSKAMAVVGVRTRSSRRKLAPGKRSRGSTEEVLQAKQERRVNNYIVEHLHQECGRTEIGSGIRWRGNLLEPRPSRRGTCVEPLLPPVLLDVRER